MEGGTRVENLERAALLGYGLKPVEFDPIFLGKLNLPATKVYVGEEMCCSAALCRPPWFVWIMITHEWEFSYEILCKTISNYIII